MSDIADQGLTTEQLANPRAAEPAVLLTLQLHLRRRTLHLPPRVTASPDARGAAREQATDPGAVPGGAAAASRRTTRR